MTALLAHPRCCCHHGPGGCPASAGLPSSPAALRPLVRRLHAYGCSSERRCAHSGARGGLSRSAGLRRRGGGLDHRCVPLCAPAAAASRTLALCCVEAAGWPGSGPHSQLHSKCRWERVVRAPVPQCLPSARMPTTRATMPPYQAEHRIGSSPSELARLEAAGGRLSRLNQYGSGPSCGTHEGVGPVRLWPGGIMVGRAIGDRDVGGILLPHPHICQVGRGFNGVVRAAVGRATGLLGMHWMAIQQSAAGSTACPHTMPAHPHPALQVRLPPTGARLVLATDGLWDAVPRGRLVRLLRQHAKPKAAAMEAVSAVATQRGGLLTDDITGGPGRHRMVADASVVHPDCGCRVQPGYCSAH